MAETLVLERMAVGEECTIDIMESAILCALKAWNEKVDEFRELLAKESITQADQALEMSAGDAAAVQSKMQARISHISSALRKYDVVKTGGALKTLGLFLGIYLSNDGISSWSIYLGKKFSKGPYSICYFGLPECR